jgi:hypothetical protein
MARYSGSRPRTRQSTSWSVRSIGWWLLVPFCVHCSDDAPVAPQADGDASASATFRLGPIGVTESPSNVLAVYVDWSTSEAATTQLHVDCGDAYQADFASNTHRFEHEVFVMGLVAEARCTATAESVSAAGAIGRRSTEFVVSALPAFLPKPQVALTNPAAVQPGWTLFNLTNQVDVKPLLVVALDEQARYRWYFQRPGPDPGDATELKVVPQGLAVGGGGGDPFTITSWEGEVLYQEYLFQHHDYYYDDQGRLVFLGIDFNCPGSFVGAINIWNLSSNTADWRWRHCDHFKPIEVAPEDDWSHLNAIERFPGENAVLISSRSQSALFKVRLDSGAIEWLFGFPPAPHQPADIPRIDLVQGVRFYEQHAPEIQPDGKTIFLFDNGSDERPYSRVIEIALDQQAREARVLREFRPTPDLYSRLWGDGDLLANGNVLGVFGSRQGTPSYIVEFSGSGQTVWKIYFDVLWGIYRADRLMEAPTGYVIER